MIITWLAFVKLELMKNSDLGLDPTPKEDDKYFSTDISENRTDPLCFSLSVKISYAAF